MTNGRFAIYRKISFFASVTTLVIGAMVILGWVAGIPILTSLNSAWVAMKVNTALGFLLSGTAVLFLFCSENQGSKAYIYDRIAILCSLLLFLIGILTLSEYWFGFNLGIDQLFWKQTGGPLDAALPGRMSPFTAVMYINYSIALLLLCKNPKTETTIITSQTCGFIGGIIGILAVIGYLLDAKELYAVGHTTAIAVHTALGFMLVSLGILFLHPQLGLMRTFTSETKTGQILRRFVPLALCLPLIIGWVRLRGQQLGLYGLESAVALMVTFCIVICEAGVFWISRKFQAIESALHQREKELHEQAELLSLTNDAIVVRELDGKIIFWNRGAEIMYGYTASDALGKISHELLQTKFSIDRRTIESIALEKGRWEGELTHHTKNQEPIVVASRWALKKDESDNPISMLEINNDISEAKEAERKVSEFYSTVSHELRTPLTSLKGVFSLLDGGRAGELSERAKHLVSMGVGESERLIRLINDILDIKKIEAGKLELTIENVEPQKLVEQTISAVTSFASQYNVEIVAEVKSNHLIKGDKDRLIQVLTNLISNAAKFSDAGQAVIVTTSKNNGAVRFAVIDKGRGIDPRNVPKLFRMFEQVGVADKSKGGTGLGLAICKSLVEQHGGSIGIESELDKGSTFWFEIPCV